MTKRKRTPPRSQSIPATAATSAPWWWPVAACLALVAAAVWLADGSVARNDWVSWDDHTTIYRNPAFNPPEFVKALRYWHTTRGHLYIPVTYTYWWVLSEAAWSPTGMDPSVFHAGSLVLHVLAAWLVLAICWKLVDSLPAATAGALLFALHPVQVETVAWASGAKDLLAGVLSLLSVWLYLMRQQATTPRGRRIYVASATFAFLLALLAKPSAVTVPLILVAVAWLAERSLSRSLLFTAGAWLLLALPIIVLTRVVQPAIGVLVPPLWQRPIIALDALGFYIQSLVWPARLTFVYGRTPEVQFASPWVNVAVAIVAAVLIAWSARRWPWVAAAAAVWLAVLLPYLGLTPFDFQMYSTVADHYLYLAMLGPAIAAAYLLRGRPAAWWVATAAALATLGLMSHRQTEIWRDPMTLLRHAVAINPNRAAPRFALGIELDARDQRMAAEREYRLALDSSPNHAEAHTNLARLLAGQGKHDEAFVHYQRAVEAAPNEALKVNNLAVGLVALQRIEEAMTVLRSGLELEDRSADDLMHANLGRLLLATGHREEARVELEKALAINPELDVARRGMEQLDSLEQ